MGLMLLTFFISNVYAQDSKIITGKIQTTTGSGIAGAVLRALPSKKTTQTDNEGNFSFSISSTDKTIEVSSLGFLSKIQTFLL